MPYPALLTLHLLVVIVFLGGLSLLAVTLPRLRPDATADLQRTRKTNRYVTTPALVLVWLLGLSLAWKGGWLGAGWLHAKIALVLVLSTLHGILSARLRRVGTAAARRTGYLPLLIMAPVVLAIIFLVGLKPG